MMGATAVVCGFALFQVPELWDEWRKLREDWENERISKPIGFIDISPNMTRAEPPDPWFREEGEALLIWSGWKHGEGHQWFRVGKGEIEPRTLILPFGRDCIRAIDQPICETQGDPLWSDLELDTDVADIAHNGIHLAYPRLLIEKVEVVNDKDTCKRPLLVVFTPFVDPNRAIHWFDPTQPDGSRLTFGLSGLMTGRDRRPFLYDRQSESLWQIRDAKLTCMAGPRKGQVLPALGTSPFLAWADWKDDHPEGHLIVGARRPGTTRLGSHGDPKPTPTAVAGASLGR
jgi:hypothetical protein